jgi:rhamnosyltransferase
MIELVDLIPVEVCHDKRTELSSSLPRVAVLLAAYNGMNYIADQVESILAQKGMDITIFCSVDCSTDGTERWVAEVAKKTGKVVLLPYGERFGGAARNFFHLIREVDFSNFDYISLSDQDDIWLEDKLCRALDMMLRLNSDAYSSNVLAFWPDGRSVVINKAQPQVSHDYLFEAAGPGCTYVFTVASALKMKSFMLQRWAEVNDARLHDWFFYAWYRVNGMCWFIDSEWRVRYRQHGNNQVGANQGLAAKYNRFRLMYSGWYWTEVARISALVLPSHDKISGCVRVKGWSKHLALLPNIGSLRRRRIDRLTLFVMIILGVF